MELDDPGACGVDQGACSCVFLAIGELGAFCAREKPELRDRIDRQREAGQLVSWVRPVAPFPECQRERQRVALRMVRGSETHTPPNY